MGLKREESRMELWGNDLAGGILLQEPYQTKAYQQDIKNPQATPNRFVNLTYLSPSKQSPSIGLQDQSNYMGCVGGSNNSQQIHPLLSPPNQTALPHTNVPPSFSRGLTMPSLNAQEAYAAAMAGFDTHKIAGHGTLKRLQQHSTQGYSSPAVRRPASNNSLQNTPPHLQKSHTDGQLKLRTIARNDEGDHNSGDRRAGIMGSTSYSSIDSGAERSSGGMKHGSSDKGLIREMNSSGGSREAESENLLSNLTASFDEKLRLLLDPHYQSSNNANMQSGVPTSALVGQRSKALSAHNTPIKTPTSNHDTFERLASPGIGRRVSDSVSSIIKSFNTDSQGMDSLGNPPRPHRSLSLGVSNHSSALSHIVQSGHASPTRNNMMTPLTAREQNEVMNQEHQKVLRKSELKRGKLVDKHKEPPLLNHNRNGQLRRNNSLTKDEKHQLNSNRKRNGDMKTNTEEKNKINSEEKENMLGGNSDELVMVVQDSADPVGVSKYRKTLANQRKIKRRHTVGGTKDFAEWEEIYNNHRNNVSDEDENAYEETEEDSDNHRQYALQAINNCIVDEAATVAAYTAATRILDRQKRQKKQRQADGMLSHGGYNVPATSSMAYRHQQPLLMHTSNRGGGENWHRQRLKHGQSSPDLIFIGTSGTYSPSHNSNSRNKNSNLESNARPSGIRHSASSMHSPKHNGKQALLDRRLSLPDSVMDVDLQIAPNVSMLHKQAFPEEASQGGMSSGSGSLNEGDRRQSNFSPSILESQV